MEGGPDLLRHFPSGLCEDAAGEAQALIARMARGDGGGLVELHGMWAPVLLGCACRMLGSRREAESVVEEAFVRMWKGAAEFTPHSSPPFVWAFDLLRGLALERLRRRRAGRREVPGGGAVPAGGRAGFSKVLVADDCRRLHAAMEQLGQEDRSHLEAAVFLGYARGAHAGASHAGLRKRLRAALEILRERLSRHEL